MAKEAELLSKRIIGHSLISDGNVPRGKQTFAASVDEMKSTRFAGRKVITGVLQGQRPDLYFWDERAENSATAVVVHVFGAHPASPYFFLLFPSCGEILQSAADHKIQHTLYRLHLLTDRTRLSTLRLSLSDVGL